MSRAYFVRYWKMENDNKNNNFFIAAIFALVMIIAGTWVYIIGLKNPVVYENTDSFTGGFVLPVVWGNLGVQMSDTGVINREKLESLYVGRGGIGEYEKKLLEDSNNGNLEITSENSGFILNLFWALGIGNKNEILENGPMSDPRYGGADRFASTGGWTLTDGNAMNHYSRHSFFVLTPEQQKLVEEISKSIYRPCCNNSTYFPDCNHGMAMLGLLELMTSQGISKEEMYKTALNVNSYWFPDTYFAINKYFNKRGMDITRVNPRELLGANYSSASGYQQVLTAIEPIQQQGVGGCSA